MFSVMLLVCASASMEQCEIHELGKTETYQGCQVVLDIHRRVLGDGHYRLDCLYVGPPEK